MEIENEYVYEIKIGTYTRKGAFQCHKQVYARSRNSKEEIREYYEKKYQGFGIGVNEVEAVDVVLETNLLKKYTTRYNSNDNTLKNKQNFLIENWVNTKLYVEWSNLIKTKERIEGEMKKEIREGLSRRIEVRDVSGILFHNETFDCVIEISGDLWKV